MTSTIIATMAAILVLGNGTPAFADFSYTVARKTTGGMMSGMAKAAGNSRMYYKDQKMKIENDDTSIILDFDAQTITTVNNRQKTWTVKRFADLTAPPRTRDVGFQIDVKETGQKKKVNGFNATELLITLEVELTGNAQAGQ